MFFLLQRLADTSFVEVVQESARLTTQILEGAVVNQKEPALNVRVTVEHMQ